MRSRLHTTICTLILLAPGCASITTDQQGKLERVEVTLWRRAQLEPFDSLIPISPDSVIGLYDRNSPEEFHVRYKAQVDSVAALIDSFNTTVDPSRRIDTLCIDHAVESFGEAGKAGKTLYISSSYFFLYNDPQVFRSLITHEFGHIHYEMLDTAARQRFRELWNQLQTAALFYLFREGEYSGNARFGGHPQESPLELFASVYNLTRNKPDELAARFRYIDSLHLPLLIAILEQATR